MTEMIEIMTNLKTQWGILKNDKSPKIDRRSACKMIIELSNEAKGLDPKFETIDMNNTQYSEFVPKTYKVVTNVNWGDIDKISISEQKASDLVDRLEAIAVEKTRKRLPNEAEDSQKFGMIVSAYTDKMLRAYTFQNS
tara:strand:- start:711 stop:1124 length:414 start_codon:yes stop_codon:yes gene_type:complete